MSITTFSSPLFSRLRIVFLFTSLIFIPVVSIAQTTLKKPAQVFGFGAIDDIAYSADGTKIAVVSHNVIAGFDPNTGARLGSMVDPVHSGYSDDPHIKCVAGSKDGKLLATGDDQGVAIIWDLDTGTAKKTINVKDGTVTDAAFSPDGKYLLVGSSYGPYWTTPTTGTLKLFNTQTGALYRKFNHTYPIKRVAYSPNGTQVVSCNPYGSTFLWSTTQNDYIRIFEGTYNVTAYDTAFSPDGNKVATVVDDSVFLWNTSSSTPIHAYSESTNHAYSVAFATDSKTLVIGGYSQAKRYSTTTGYSLLKTYNVGQAYVRSIALSHDASSSKLVTASNFWGGEIKIFATSSGNTLRTIHGHNRGVYSLAVSPDGRRLVTGANSYGSESDWESSQAKIYDMATGTELACLPGTGGVTSVDISPDGKKILTASFGGNGLKLWTINGTFIREIKEVRDGQPSYVSASCAAFAEGDKKILTGISRWSDSANVWQGVISVFDTSTTGGKLTEIAPLGDDISSIAVAPDVNRQTFIGGSATYNTGKAYLRHLTSSTLNHDFPVNALILSVAINWNRSLVLTGGAGVKMWNTATGEKVREFSSSGRVVIFSPDGGSVAAGDGWTLDNYDNGGYGRVQVWNANTGVLLKTIQAQRAVIQALAFTNTGGLLSGSEDGSVMLWEGIVKSTATDKTWNAYE